MDNAASASLEFKGATVPAVRLMLASLDPRWLQAAIARTLGSAPDFFDAELAVLDLSAVQPGGPDPDWSAIAGLLADRGLVLAAVSPGDERIVASAREVGLAVVSLARPTAPRAAEPEPRAAPPAARHGDRGEERGEAAGSATLIIDRPLRSGQQIYARGRDIVLLAQASTGSEIIADGSIHVYAPLRGRALAGARGDTNARIFTTSFEADLVSIAGVYRNFGAGIPAELHHQPAQVRLVAIADRDPSLVIEPLKLG